MTHFLRIAGLLALPFLPPCAFPQATYWGMSSAGGVSGVGTIYTVTEANVLTKKYDFFRYEGGNPRGDLLKASDGLYYGVTEFGGTNGLGILFSYNPTSLAYTVLANFSAATTGVAAVGAQPVGGLVQPSNGKLYGICQYGGANNKGTIFEYTIATAVLAKKVDFNSTNGELPFARLVIGSTGTMWGTTVKGGTNSTGTIFEYTQASTSVSVRFSFLAAGPSNTSGIAPRASLVKATNGRFYGVAPAGGVNGAGTVFELLNSSPYTFTVVQALGTTNGGQPIGGLVEGSNNVLFGTTTTAGANSAGTIFKVTATALPATFAKVYDMVTATGSNVFSHMIKASAANLLYGTCSDGGTTSNGALFSFNTSTNAYTMLADLGTAGYSDMWGAVIEDPAGTLYGLTNTGGTASSGALFKYVISSNTFTQAVAFALSNGSIPKGRLLKASNGLFYGFCSAGGSSSSGVFFSYNPTTSVFTRITDLNSTLGTFPTGSLTEVSGKLYGLCNTGGANNLGSVVEYTIATNTFAKKADFSTTLGTLPQNGLTVASNGKMYGITSAGGTNALGTIFEYVPGASTVTKLRDLSTADGSVPLADLVQGSNGLLYGTNSQNGQYSRGTLFSFDPSSSAFTRLYSFDGLQGGTPAGDVLEVTGGKLYGMCSEEGLFDHGCIYSWTVASNLYTEEYDMAATPNEGSLSQSNLLLGTDGLLYGTCTQGGTNDLGTIFKFNMATLAYTVMQNFAGGTEEQYPFDGLAKETVPVPTAVTLNAKLFLEGPFVVATGRMNDALRTLGTFPTSEPYTAAGFTMVGSGGETIAPSVLTVTGDNAIVDWVLVELRDKNNSATILRTKPALLQKDGDVVDLNGTSAVSMTIAADNYFIALRHRNHFAVMSASPIALSASPASVNFTDGTVATYGTSAQKLSGTIRLNWAGNVVRDALLKYTGTSNDRDPILIRVGSIPTTAVPGYFMEDVNLDGVVKYTGSANDRDPILVNVGSTVPTATRAQQLP